MAKKSTTESTTTATQTPQTPQTQETPVTETPPATAPTALVAASAHVEIALVEKTWLDEIPKGIRDALDATAPIEEGEMEALRANLPDAQRAAFEGFAARMNPVKEGVLVSNSRFQVPSLRMYHGVGDDPGKPALAPVGSIWSGDGRIVCVWDKGQAKLLNVGQTFDAAVVGLQEARTWWPPRDKSIPLPEGVDPASKGPICKSLDRKRGERYGNCGACPHRPYANGKYNANGCHDEIVFYLVMRDFTGIYQITLKGASIKNAVAPFRRSLTSMIKPWDKWFTFGLAEEKNTSGRWFSLTAVPASDGPAVQESEHALLGAISRQILMEIYKPALQAAYERTAIAAPAEASADMAALLAAAGGSSGPAPDYSKNNL